MAKRFYCPDPAAEVRDLVAGLKEQDSLFVGIDPGVTGAFAFVPTNRKVYPVLVDMPALYTTVKSHRKGKQTDTVRSHFNYADIVTLLDPLIDVRDKVIIALERGQCRAEDTAKTGFGVGVAYGMWQLYFTAFGFRVEELLPSVWKVKMGLAKKDKNFSRSMAMRLYPQVAHFLAAASDHNRAEALLLADFIKNNKQGRVSHG